MNAASLEEASLWRARRREAVAAAPGRGGLARGARGEVGLRGSERKHGEKAQTQTEPALPGDAGSPYHLCYRSPADVCRSDPRGSTFPTQLSLRKGLRSTAEGGGKQRPTTYTYM